MTTPPTYDFDAMELRHDVARAALSDVSLLERAFVWEHTPQGREYWEQQAASGLDQTARSTVCFMVAQSIAIEFHAQFFRRAA